MDNPIVDSTAATVITKTAAITNPIKLLIEDDTIKKFKEIERSITLMEIKRWIIFVLVITIPNILITKIINGNISKEYIILILSHLSFAHKLSLITKSIRIKGERPDQKIAYRSWK